MTRFLHFLLVAGAISALLGGCASRAKPPLTSGLAATAQPQQSDTELPRGGETPHGSAGRGSQAELAVAAGDRVYFALDSAALDGQARETLQRQAAWLRARPEVQARIEGNADERGTREYNLALGARRAAAARQALISAGVGATRLETVSFGKERPLDPSMHEEAWAKNRNAGTVVIGLSSP